MKEIIFKEEVYVIVGAAMDVYYQLGRGFLEPVYQEALDIEFRRRKIPFKAKEEILIYYKGEPLKKKYEYLLWKNRHRAEGARRIKWPRGGTTSELHEGNEI